MYFNSPATTTNFYTPIWNKYRPAILQLMIASVDSPQQYKLFGHEFRALNPKEKSGYAFKLQVFQGKAVKNIKTKTSPIAKDLLEVLEQSKKATELMSNDTYEFVLDKQFVLHVTKLQVSVS